MLKIKNNNSIKLFIVFTLVFFFVANFSFAKEVGGVNVKNSIEANADTGGNKIRGEGVLETGNASVSVESFTSVNGKDSAVEAEIKTKTNNQELSIKIIDPGSVEVLKNENCEENAESCNFSISDNPSEEVGKNNKDNTESDRSKFGFFENILDFFQDFFDKVKT